MLSSRALIEKHFGLILFLTLGILYIPIDFYFRNIENFSYDFSLLLTPVLISVTILVFYLTLNKYIGERVNFLLAGLGISVWSCDQWLKANYSLLDGQQQFIEQSLHLQALNGFIYLSLPLLFLLIRKLLKHHLPWLSALCLLGIALAYSSAVFYSITIDRGHGENKKSNDVQLQNSQIEKKPNIYLIWLDSLDRTELATYLRSKNNDDGMEGFRFFSKNTSSYIYSNYSFLSFMSGVSNFDELPNLDKQNSLKPRILYQALKDNNYNVSAYTKETFKTGLEDTFYNSNEILQKNNSSSMYYVDFNTYWLSRSLPTFVSTRYFNKIVQLFSKQQESIPTNVASGIEPYTGVRILQEALSDESERSSYNEFVLIHAVIPHGPFKINENCEYSKALTSYSAQQDCAMSLVKSFLKNLKRLERYDNSLIVIFGDHGAGWENISQDQGDSEVLNKVIHNSWTVSQIEGRAKAALMIKPANEVDQTKELSFSQVETQLNDIVPTIIAGVDLEIPKQYPYHKIDGRNVFGKNLPDREKYLYYFPPKGKLEAFDTVRYRMYFDNETSEYKIDSESQSVSHEIAYLGANLPSQFDDLAIKADGKISISGTKKGFLTFGPYLSLPPGTYEMSVKYRYENMSQNQPDNESYWDITASAGKLKLYKKPFTSSPNQYTLDNTKIYIPHDLKKIELRTFYGGSGELVIDKINIKKMPQQLVCSETIPFNADTSISYYNFSNLSLQEPWGRWSDGRTAEIEFQTEPDCNAKSVTFNLKAFVTPKNPKQMARVFVNYELVGEIQISADEAQPKKFTFALPDDQDNKYTIRFEIDKPTTPKSVGVNADTRELGFGFIDMRLLPDEVTAQ